MRAVQTAVLATCTALARSRGFGGARACFCASQRAATSSSHCSNSFAAVTSSTPPPLICSTTGLCMGLAGRPPCIVQHRHDEKHLVHAPADLEFKRRGPRSVRGSASHHSRRQTFAGSFPHPVFGSWSPKMPSACGESLRARQHRLVGYHVLLLAAMRPTHDVLGIDECNQRKLALKSPAGRLSVWERRYGPLRCETSRLDTGLQ